MNSAMVKWRTDSSDISNDTYNMIYVCTWRLPVHQHMFNYTFLPIFPKFLKLILGGTVSPSELNHGSSGSSLEGVHINQ